MERKRLGKINLLAKFPISPHFLVRENLRLLALSALLLFGLSFAVQALVSNLALPASSSLLELKQGTLATLIVLFVAGNLAVDYLYLSTFKLFLTVGHLKIQHGLFRRKELAVPLSPCFEYQLHSSSLDQMFGTKDLVIRSLVEGDADEVARIPALPAKKAEELQNKLLELACGGHVGENGTCALVGPSNPPLLGRQASAA